MEYRLGQHRLCVCVLRCRGECLEDGVMVSVLPDCVVVVGGLDSWFQFRSDVTFEPIGFKDNERKEMRKSWWNVCFPGGGSVG